MNLVMGGIINGIYNSIIFRVLCKYQLLHPKFQTQVSLFTIQLMIDHFIFSLLNDV